MIKRLPIIPTIVVVAAAALMVWLGVWQLQRAKLHKAQLASFVAASRKPPIAFPTIPIRNYDTLLYRYATGNCLRVVGRRTSVGENRSGEPGFVIIFDCATGAEGPGMSVEVGWSKNPNARTTWNGGLVSGVIVGDDKTRFRLVSATAAPGLEAVTPPKPSVKVSPARNKGYAATWFAFALIALIIYGLAVRKRSKEANPPQ
jgi:cytochrome oxidase assembly protein ShyY1